MIRTISRSIAPLAFTFSLAVAIFACQSTSAAHHYRSHIKKNGAVVVKSHCHGHRHSIHAGHGVGVVRYYRVGKCGIGGCK